MACCTPRSSKKYGQQVKAVWSGTTAKNIRLESVYVHVFGIITNLDYGHRKPDGKFVVYKVDADADPNLRIL